MSCAARPTTSSSFRTWHPRSSVPTSTANRSISTGATTRMSSTLPDRFLVPNGRRGEGPVRDCPHCPRLVAFRAQNREVFPDFHNSPVASFGGTDARLLVVGLAPGLKGANRTGRPFTGDYAGDLLYRTLLKFGFAEGDYRADPDDSLRLVGARITNAVRCVPPENKPTPNEVATCRAFLEHEIASLERLAAEIG